MATLPTAGFYSSAPPPAASPAPASRPSSPLPPAKFRFKSKSSRNPSRGYQCRSRSRSRSPSPSHRPRHHHRHRHRHRHSHSHSASKHKSTPPYESPPVSPNTAFRESLFDALADDEGAAYWEGVYGQPIHIYGAYHQTSDSPHGELEQMTEEEYVSYVRAKMWERSHGYVLEERQRRKERTEEEKRKKEEEVKRRKEWDGRLEEALKRREDTEGMRWQDCWEGYLRGWRERVVWPVKSGRREDVRKEEVERFFEHAPFAKARERPREEKLDDLGAVLKAERMRWHPDKVQQRFGSQGIDDATMKAVTAVFQIVDQMWTETRGK